MASAAVQNKTPRKVLKKSTRDSLIAYSFIAPNFIGFCVFTLVPMVFAIALAFCAWDGRHAIEFIGLKNFVKLFTTDKIFQAALKNTVVYVIGTVPLTLACSLAMAVLLNQNVALNKTSGGSFYRKSMQGGMCDVMAYKNDSGDQSYVSWANKDGATYIFCIMQSPDTCDDYGYSNRRPALYETTKLIDWVFESFSIQAALDTDQALAEIPVKYSSDTDTLQLYPADSMMTLLPSTGDGSVTQKYFHLPDYATAPIQQGDVVGTVELKLAGETIGVVNLIAGQDVHQNALLFTVSKVQAFFHSLYLKVVIVLSLLTLAVYGLWVFINLWNGRRPNRKIHRR